MTPRQRHATFALAPYHEPLPASTRRPQMPIRSQSTTAVQARPFRSSPLAGPSLSSDGSRVGGPPLPRTQSDSALAFPQQAILKHDRRPILKESISAGNVLSRPDVLTPPKPSFSPRRPRSAPDHNDTTTHFKPPRPLSALFIPAAPEHAPAPRPSPSVSRDPTQNWLTHSMYDETPRFSRLSLAASGVVLPVSAREYGKKVKRSDSRV
ncbi:hypothetical protein PLICRDRAFT_38276, partial [Plicaturopsis crispa FD-325 SS-3]